MSAELFVELRCEEIPAGMVRPALAGLRDGLLALLDGVTHGEVRTWATPRRLAVAIADLASARPTETRQITGPPADRAFDADGTPTKTGLGFAASKGVDPSELTIVELPKRGAVVAITVTEGGESVHTLIAEGLGGVIERIPWKKAMVWGEGGLSFGRPLHGIVVLHGAEPVVGSAHGIAFGQVTLGHRLFPEPLTVTSADGWLEGLRERKVEPDLDRREASIRGILRQVAAELGSDPIVDDALVEEVLHLVEWPMPITGTFDIDLLDLPPRLLVTAMKVHQRYFPVFEDGSLTNRFVVISNNPQADADLVAQGNARVLRARFYDARFFLAEDRKQPLSALSDKLDRMRWIRGLGTMADKQRRVGALSATLAPLCGAEPDLARLAGGLCKADLTSQMVGEFPDLQGHMGRLYAVHHGLPAAVGAAIEEHYQPAGADDDVAASPTGAALALADRLDTLVGCFAIGMEPSGSGDPQGLRRAALGLVRTLQARGLRVSLRSLYADAHQAWEADLADLTDRSTFDRWSSVDGTALSDRLTAFTLTRLKASLVAGGASPDVVDAVLTAEGAPDDVLSLASRVAAIGSVAGTDDFPAILQTFKRVLNVGGDVEHVAPSDQACTEPVERALLHAALQASTAVAEAQAVLDDAAALDAVLGLRAPVEAFFDGIFVNADDPAVRAVRLGIVGEVARTFRRVADFSRITTR